MLGAKTPDAIMDDQVTSFEYLVHQQRPALEPWRPVTDYSFEARRAIEGKHPELIRSVLDPVHVLDYGCGPDAILVRLLRDIGVQAWGMDPILKQEWNRYRSNTNSSRAYDVVVCREVFEHMTILGIRHAVAELVRCSTRLIYVTTRFAKTPDHLLSVDTSDDLDPTHITMLTKPFLRLLFVLEGCRSRPDLEAQMDWQGKGRCLVMEVPS